MRTQVAVLLALAAPLYAVEITSPSKNDVVDPSKGVTVKWSTVSTDPARAHLVLVNMAAGHTPFTKDLGEVDLSTGSLTISQKDVPSDAGYQFNFESTAAQNTGILAQSEQFEVKSSSSSHTDDDQSTSAAASSSPATAGTTAVRSMTSSLTSADSVTTITGASRTLATSTTDSAAATGSETESAASSTSTAAAAATGMASQSGSLLALVIGVAAVLA